MDGVNATAVDVANIIKMAKFFKTIVLEGKVVDEGEEGREGVVSCLEEDDLLQERQDSVTSVLLEEGDAREGDSAEVVLLEGDLLAEEGDGGRGKAEEGEEGVYLPLCVIPDLDTRCVLPTPIVSCVSPSMCSVPRP